MVLTRRLYHFKRKHSLCQEPDHDLLTPRIAADNIAIIEQQLKIVTNDETFENITDETLTTAARLYLFLNSCSKEYHYWIPFFEELLFSNVTSDVVILTLNRLTKKENVPNIIKTVAKSLLKTTLKQDWSLEFEKIEMIANPKFQNSNKSNERLRTPGSGL